MLFFPAQGAFRIIEKNGRPVFQYQIHKKKGPELMQVEFVICESLDLRALTLVFDRDGSARFILPELIVVDVSASRCESCCNSSGSGA